MKFLEIFGRLLYLCNFILFGTKALTKTRTGLLKAENSFVSNFKGIAEPDPVRSRARKKTTTASASQADSRTCWVRVDVGINVNASPPVEPKDTDFETCANIKSHSYNIAQSEYKGAYLM